MNQAQQQDAHYADDNELTRDELRMALSVLRDDFYTMASDVRTMLQENARLSDEVARLKSTPRQSAPRRSRPVNDAQRIKQECVEGLDRLQQLAGRLRGAPPQQEPQVAAPPPPPPPAAPAANNADAMKKMMLFMMLSELA